MLQMRSVELFTGAGGLAIGLARCDFAHDIVIERDEDSCGTIRLNQRRGVEPVAHWELFSDDVCRFDYGTIAPGVDLVAGGPPCQPFSLGGKHGGHRDARNMFPEAVRAVRELQPRAFVFENVKGLLRESFTNFFQFILIQLEFPRFPRQPDEDWTAHQARLQRLKTEGRYDGLRYNIVVNLLNAANYGVPQKRERVFIVGFRSDIGEKWSFPTRTHSKEALFLDMWRTGEYWERHGIVRRQRPSGLAKTLERLQDSPPSILRPWRTVRDAISDLPNPVTNPNNGIPNHVHNPGARNYAGHTGSSMDEPAKTLKAGDHGVPGGENTVILQNGRVRYFTVRESARLQTFPDNYVFSGSWGESMRQIGNAVPVELAQIVGQSVAECLNRVTH